MDLSFRRFCMTQNESVRPKNGRAIKLIPKNPYFPEDFFKQPVNLQEFQETPTFQEHKPIQIRSQSFRNDFNAKYHEQLRNEDIKQTFKKKCFLRESQKSLPQIDNLIKRSNSVYAGGKGIKGPDQNKNSYIQIANLVTNKENRIQLNRRQYNSSQTIRELPKKKFNSTNQYSSKYLSQHSMNNSKESIESNKPRKATIYQVMRRRLIDQELCKFFQ